MDAANAQVRILPFGSVQVSAKFGQAMAGSPAAPDQEPAEKMRVLNDSTALTRIFTSPAPSLQATLSGRPLL